jgi:hypothetical protein
MTGGPLALQSGLEIHEHAQLFQKHRDADVAMERNDFAILQVEDVATGRLHPLSGRQDRARWNRKCAIQGQFDDYDVIIEVEVIKLPVHVRKCGSIDVNRNPDVIPVVFLAGGDVVEVAAIGEQ